MRKSKLQAIRKNSLCLHETEMKLFVNWKDDSRKVDRVDRCRQLKTLVDRFFLGAVSVEECKSLLMIAVYRIGLSRSEQGIMDRRTIKSYQDLSELALMLKSITVGNKEELRSQEKRREDRYQKEDRSRVKCYKCNRFGHSSYECRLKSIEES